MQEISWSEADARRLKMLRLEAGYDLVQFSRLSSVSVAQITQLEESGDSLFYSSRIKYAVGKRLTLLLLKSQQSLSSNDPLIDEGPRSRSPTALSEINAIVELSSRNLDAKPIKEFMAHAAHQTTDLLRSKYVMSSMGMVLLMLSVWFYEHHGEDPMVTTPFEVQSKWSEEALDVASTQWLGVEQFLGGALDGVKSFFDFFPSPSSLVLAPKGIDPSPSPLRSETPVDTLKARIDGSPPIPQVGELVNNNASLVSVSAAAASEQGCAQGVDAPQVSPTAAYKPGNYVYLVALVDTTVCLQDGQNKINRLNLSSGSSQTVPGTPPWKVSLRAADEAKVFYQGQRIQPPTTGSAGQVFTLVEFKPNENRGQD